MATIDDDIALLQSEVTRETTINNSAIVLLNGIQARIDAAVANATAAGATAAQLQSLTDLSAALKSNSDALSAAVTANTPAAPAA